MDNADLLALLNENFKTCTLEKHPDANMSFLVREAATKILGTNFSKTKVGVKKQYSIHSLVLKQMQNRYGPMVNVRILNLKKWQWDTNLSRIYKTDQGRLFGTFIYDDFFFTSHSLERWEERINPEIFKYYSQYFKLRFHTAPTNFDTLLFNMQITHQIGLKREQPTYRYLNMNQGCLIIEVLGGLCVAKTFLSIDMIKDDKNIVWYNQEKPVLKEISDCICPPEDLVEDFDPRDEEVPIDFCIKYFKRY
jgi:hypothetical protein